MTAGPHRRYTKRQKLAVVTAAMASSVLAAAETAGVPESTARYWFDSPEFAELREKTREQRAEMMSALSVQVVSEIQRRLPEFEPRDLSVLMGILTDKAQLLGGAATSRAEHRDVTATLPDNEREALADAIEEWLAVPR